MRRLRLVGLSPDGRNVVCVDDAVQSLPFLPTTDCVRR